MHKFSTPYMCSSKCSFHISSALYIFIFTRQLTFSCCSLLMYYASGRTTFSWIISIFLLNLTTTFLFAEGPLAHDQPTYAGLPGINVYGMLCVPPESYAPKPLKTPSSQSIYNKWRPGNNRPSAPVSSYRDTEYRSFQNATGATADAE